MSGGLAGGAVLGLLQPIFFGVGFWQLEHAMRRHADPAPSEMEHVAAAAGASVSCARMGDAMVGVGAAAADGAVASAAGKVEVGAAAAGLRPSVCLPIALTAWNLLAVCLLSVCWMLGGSLGGASGAGGDSSGLAGLSRVVSAIGADPTAQTALIGTILWTGLGTTAGCSLVEAAALGELSSSEATVVFSTEPLWGALFAYVYPTPAPPFTSHTAYTAYSSTPAHTHHHPTATRTRTRTQSRTQLHIDTRGDTHLMPPCMLILQVRHAG